MEACLHPLHLRSLLFLSTYNTTNRLTAFHNYVIILKDILYKINL
jgi:hypothetical protein